VVVSIKHKSMILVVEQFWQSSLYQYSPFERKGMGLVSEGIVGYIIKVKCQILVVDQREEDRKVIEVDCKSISKENITLIENIVTRMM